MNTPASVSWIPETALRRFGAEVDVVVERWSGEWGVPRPSPGNVCAVDRNRFVDDLSLAEPVGAQADTGAWLKAARGLDTSVGRLLFGDGTSSAAVAKEIGALATAALLDKTRDFLRDIQITQSVAAASGTDRMPGHWGARYALAVGRHEIEILAPTPWLSARGWLARPARKPVQAWSPTQALAAVQVKLTVQIGSADLSVGEMSDIGSDDVILVNGSSTDPVFVKVEETDIQFRAFLGSNGASRAVQLVSESKRTST